MASCTFFQEFNHKFFSITLSAPSPLPLSPRKKRSGRGDPVLRFNLFTRKKTIKIPQILILDPLSRSAFYEGRGVGVRVSNSVRVSNLAHSLTNAKSLLKSHE